MANIYEYRLKIYNNGVSEYVHFKQGKTTSDGNYKINQVSNNSSKQLKIEDSKYLPRQDSLTELQKLSRRKSKVRDYVLSGNFYSFGTLTFRPDIAPSSLDDYTRLVMRHFTRMLRRRGVRYYIVAEKHTGGGINHGKIHLHGLFSENLETIRSRKHSKYLSTPLWQHGFSSIGRIRDQTATANYVTKYVTKEAIEGKSVWVSQGLMTPQVLYNVPDLLTPIVSEWENENIKKIIRSI